MNTRVINIYKMIVNDPVLRCVFGIALSWWLSSPSIWHSTPEDRIKWCGLLLQLMGFGVVGFGIYETLKQFGRQSLRDWFVEWVARWVGVFKKPVNGSANIMIEGVDAMSSTGSVSPAVSSNSTLESRIAALEDKAIAAQRDIAAMRSSIDDEIRRRIDAIKSEEGARKQEHQEIRGLIESLSVGGMTLEIIGFVWVCVGTVLSTISVEIAAL